MSAQPLAQLSHTVQSALAAMRHKRAVILGDLILDSYIYGETGRVSREAPVLVVSKQRAEHRLGGAANTAANLAALGLSTTVVGAVGSDANGEILRTMLKNAGVRDDGIVRADGPTTVKTRILAGAPGTSKQQVLRLDDEPQEDLLQALQPSLLAALSAHAEAADVIVVSDYGLGTLQDMLVDAARDLAQRGKIVCVDSRYRLLAFHGVTAVTPNLPEAEAAVGYSLGGAAQVQKAGAQIVQQGNFQACLLTQGRGGMTLFAPRGSADHVEIVGDEEVTDVTGAGDTVIATFAASMAAGVGRGNAMRLANCAAGIVVTKMGTAVARPAEIEAWASRFVLELEPWDASPTSTP